VEVGGESSDSESITVVGNRLAEVVCNTLGFGIAHTVGVTARLARPTRLVPPAAMMTTSVIPLTFVFPRRSEGSDEEEGGRSQDGGERSHLYCPVVELFGWRYKPGG